MTTFKEIKYNILLHVAAFVSILTIISATATGYAVQEKKIIPPEIQTELQKIAPNANSDNVIALVKKLYQWGTDNNRPDVCARVLSRYGAYLNNLSYYDLSSDIFRCANYFVVPEDERVTIYTLASQAIADFHNGSQAEAEKTLNSVLGRARKLPDNIQKQILLYTIYTYLGVINSEKGHEPKAYEYYSQALSIAQNAGDASMVCTIVSRITKLKFYDDPKIDTLLKSSLQLAIKADDRPDIYELLTAQAQRSYNSGNYQLALNQLDRASQYATLLQNNGDIQYPIQEASDYLELRSQCYAAMKEFSLAYQSENDYIKATMNFREQNSKLHNKHWVLCHDLIAKSEMYRSGTMVEEQKSKGYILLIIAVVVFIIIFVAYYKGRHIYKHFKKDQQRIAKLEDSVSQSDNTTMELGKLNQELRDELTEARRKLSVSSLYNHSRNLLLRRIRELVREGYSMDNEKQLNQMKRISALVSQSLLDDRKQEEKLERFVSSDNKDFIDNLKSKYPSLTDTEIKLAMFIHLGISTRNIAQVTGQQVKTVSVARYRLRKTLGFDSDQEMIDALMAM